MTKKNKSSLLLTLGAAGLLIGGGAAAYWFLLQRNGGPGDVPVGANIIPQSALLAISVSTNLGQWQQLRQFGTAKTQAQLDQTLTQLSDRFLTSNGYNYQQDIQPWIGKEATIAFLSPQSSSPDSNAPTPPTAVRQQSFEVVLPIANPIAAKQLLEKPNILKQGKWVDRTYKGIAIKETQGVPSQNYSAAVLDGRFLVVTDSPKATELVIDTYKGGASLAATSGFKANLSKIATNQPFAQLYVNVPAAARVAAANSAHLSSQGLTQLQQNQGLATDITLEQDGIRFKSISWLKPDSQRVQVVENNAGKMPSRLPSETLMMVSGGNLQRLWQDYTHGAQSNPRFTPFPPQNLRSGVQSLTGLDLEQDLLSWMGSEFSLSLIPSTQKGSPENSALSLVFMVQAVDRSRAEKALQQLDQVMSRQYQFQVKEATVGGQPVVNWIAPYGTLTATHGWLDGDVAFLTLGAPLASAIVPKPAASLATTDKFQKTVPSELSPNNGEFFLDVDRTDKVLPLPQLLPNQQMFMEAMHAIGVTAAISDERSTRYDIFVSLKKVGNPGSLPSPSVSP